MKRQRRTNKTGLILSLVFISSCAATSFPRENLYIPDLTNHVCAEYEIESLTEITFRWIQDLNLVAGGPCDRMAGWTRKGFKNIQNWARDKIAEGN